MISNLMKSSIAIAVVVIACVKSVPADDAGDPAWQITVEINGQPHADALLQVYRDLLSMHDRDADGYLLFEEAGRLPTRFGMRQLAIGRVLPAIGPVPVTADSDLDRRLSAKELRDYYQPSPGYRLLSGRAPSNARMTASLLAILRINPGDLTDQLAIESAIDRLKSRDGNGDGLIGPEEILPGMKYPGTNATAVTDSKADWLAGMPPLRVSLQQSRFSLRLASDDQHATEGPLWIRSSSAWTRIETRFAEPDDLLGQIAKIAAVHKEVAATLKASETELAEMAPNHVELARFRNLVDVDQDACVTDEEWLQWQDFVRGSLDTTCVITVVDFEQNLFTLLDQNHDGSLSRAELDSAWSILSSSGAIQGGKMLPNRVPRQLRIIVSNAFPRRLLATSAETGPAWFRAMDRNHDGEISSREFTGPVEVFERLDSDSNDRVTASEAEAVSPER